MYKDTIFSNMLSTFSVCLHHIHFMLYSFISEYCRDFQFVTALWIPKENQKLQMQHYVLTYITINNLQKKIQNFLYFCCTPFSQFINAFQSWQFSFDVTNHPKLLVDLKSTFRRISILFKPKTMVYDKICIWALKTVCYIFLQ